MAGNNEIIGVDQDIEALSTTRIRDVMIVGVTTQPSQVYFEFRLPVKGYTAAAAHSQAETIAGNLETIMGSDLIGGLSFTEVVQKSGLLVPSMDIIVTTPAGDASAVISRPLKGLTWDSISGLVIATVNDLYASLG